MTHPNKVPFTKSGNDIRLMAIFLAQLTREGVTYKIQEYASSYEIEITGF